MTTVRLLRPFRLLLGALAALTIALCVFFARTPCPAILAELSPLETRFSGSTTGCAVGRPRCG